jgi:NDP-sugar pyrophosphorylase family protein
MIKTAMILGAGFGRRLQPLSLIQPKPLFQVLNKTMLEWWAEFLASAGVKRIVINVHYQAPLMLERIERLAAGFKDRLTIAASAEDELLGTGGALKKAAPLLGKDDFLVVNSDIFTDFELVKLALKHLANPGRLATLGLLELPQTARVSLGENGRIISFRQPQPAPGEVGRQTYGGVMAVSPAIFNYIPETGASDSIEVFLKTLAVGAEIYGWTNDPAIWRDMGTLEDYWGLNRDLAAGRAIIHSTAAVRGRLSGWNVVGAGAVIEEGAEVENCVIWPGALISGKSAAKNTVIAGVLPPGRRLAGGAFCDELVSAP